MTEFYTRKKIDNSRLVRSKAPGRVGHYCRVIGLSSMMAGGGMAWAWQHFQCIQLGYQLEELKAERSQALELNVQLKLEAAGLRSPERIDAIARGRLGLTAPLPGQVTPVSSPGDAILANARLTRDTVTQ
ncbi:MAG: cell division protein FtsL [Acidobacteria bacterium]|nr:cell division protein FtsL [Acidobacteriota bacterium]